MPRKKKSNNLYRLKAKASVALTKIASVQYAPRYALFGLIILLGTTVFWSLLGSNLQSSNADQLVNSYLFKNSSTFHGSIYPSAHTFLLKWPLFWLIHILGSSGFTFALFTVLISVATVGALAWILYEIDRRPAVFGTLCLALASALLLVPAQPYAGGILPVNMAMIATRNIEYVLYLAVLILLIKSHDFKDRRFWLAGILLGVLIASDKLFLVLSLGGAGLTLFFYGLAKGWNMVSIAARWLLAGLLASGGAILLLGLLNSIAVAHIRVQAGFGPYGLFQGARNLGLGVLYGILGLLTNIGANPAFDANEVRNIAHQLVHHLISTAGPEFIINFGLVIFGLYAVYKLIAKSLAHNKDKEMPLDEWPKLAVMLIWTTVIAFGVFVLSNHYYAVDARYLTISLFTLFISIAALASENEWSSRILVGAGVVITAVMALGTPFVVNNTNASKSVLAETNRRNAVIAQAISHHNVNILVGDYWRVLPAKLASGNKLNIMPLAACGQLRGDLTSTAWQPDLNKNGFAYLLTLDKSLTGYQGCSLDQIINDYGRPNASALIAGSLSSPKELLLFYDNGAHKSAALTHLKTPSTVLPISIGDIPQSEVSCPASTSLNIVAHQDDDLLFINPDIARDIQAGRCERTVYVTAGDAGSGRYYWLSRERGTEAAYDFMDGPGQDIWIKRIVQINDHEYINIDTPRSNPKISLIFMQLPDGGLKGQGFRSTKFESLAKLEAGKIKQMYTIDGQSFYTANDLADTLQGLMNLYSPAEIRTQSTYTSHKFPDHSDHIAVSRFVKNAYNNYEAMQFENRVTIPISFYIGYPVHGMSDDVSGLDLTISEGAFLKYAAFDKKVCQTATTCDQTPTYGAYLRRQYKSPY